MIVVVGSPIGRRTLNRLEPAGLAVAVARAAAAAGVTVQLVGKVGDGPDGDAILVSLAEAGVGHVALLRDLESVPTIEDRESESSTAGDVVARDETLHRLPAGAPLDAGDLALALRYLPDYDVVVVAQPLDPAAGDAVLEAARWAGAKLVVIAPMAAALPEEATVLEPPDDDAEGAFATMVGRYAAALSRGDAPADAFAEASSGTGWAPAAGD